MHPNIHSSTIYNSQDMDGTYPLTDEQIQICPWDSLGKNAGRGWRAFLQGIFPTQAWDAHLLSRLHWQAGSLPLETPGKLYPMDRRLVGYSAWAWKSQTWVSY